MRKLPANQNELENVKVVIPLKHLCRFIFSLDTLLINAEIELILKWTQNCVLTERATREHIDESDDPAAEPEVDENDSPSDVNFSITNCKMYVPVVTLQGEYQTKLYEELKIGITISVTWNKYRSQVINQSATNNLNYLIDPTFNNVHRLFVLAFERKTNKQTKKKTDHVLVK